MEKSTLSILRDFFKNNPGRLSIVSPIYKSEKSLKELVTRVSKVCDEFISDYEIILVDDRCPNNSWGMIKELVESNVNVKGLRLSRNFGQHNAITAGLSKSTGSYVIVMDCDLQDDPKYIPSLVKCCLDGYEIVFTRKDKREHGFFKNISARLFSFLFNNLVEDSAQLYDVGVGTFSLLTRKAVNVYLNMNDKQRHYLMLLRWIGFSNYTIQIDHNKRIYGKSSYNLKRLFRHAVNGITSQSDKLLYISIYIGFIIFLLSLIAGLWIIIGYFVHGYKEGWGSLIVTILFSTSAILMSLGVNGVYLAKNFEQTKNRPLYIIDEEIGKENNGLPRI